VLKRVYPNRHLPSPTDKDYGKKLLAISDEGEKHVMLDGLFHTFQMMNILLTGAMFILIVYSLGANHSHRFSILVIGLVLVSLNANDMLMIRHRLISKSTAIKRGCDFYVHYAERRCCRA
ncbi:DUF3169 family protein, partial [Weissella confusa]